MAPCDFEVGGWYRNQRCRYRVVEIDDDVLLVRLDDGSECSLDAREQAKVSRHTEPPWWLCASDSRRYAATELRKRGVQHVHHFSAMENLPGIRDVDAICSKMTLVRMNRRPMVPGGNEYSQQRDWENDNAAFVSLSFAWHTPQFFVRLRDRPLVAFCVSPEVVGAEGAVIYDTNANASAAESFFNLSDALPHLNFQLFARPSPGPPAADSSEKHDLQAEVLIPDRVPLEFVERIVVDQRLRHADVERVFGDRIPIAVVNFKEWQHGDLPQPNVPRQLRPGPPPDHCK
jgi:hypothetical protein